MDTDKKKEIENCPHAWIRSLIKKYNLSDNKMERDILMEKMTRAYNKILEAQMIVDCG